MSRRRRCAGYLLLVAVALTAITFSSRRSRQPVHSVVLPPPPGESLCLTQFGIPASAHNDGQIIVKSAYECLHSRRLKISRWVAYRADGDDTTRRERYRGKFYAEPQLKRTERAEESDYAGLYQRDLNGFDRGHQAPDATIKLFGARAQYETYSLANITPQHSRVNQGTWQDIEAAIRGWSSPASPVWVITGPVFFPNQETIWVGSNHVAVPHGYYAIASRTSSAEVLAFLVPNVAVPRWTTSIAAFLVSVDSIEKLTALDFFPLLPDSIQLRLESHPAQTLWPSR